MNDTNINKELKKLFILTATILSIIMALSIFYLNIKFSNYNISNIYYDDSTNKQFYLISNTIFCLFIYFILSVNIKIIFQNVSKNIKRLLKIPFLSLIITPFFIMAFAKENDYVSIIVIEYLVILNINYFSYLFLVNSKLESKFKDNYRDFPLIFK